MQACQITASSTKYDWGDLILCSSRRLLDSESEGLHNTTVNGNGQSRNLDDGSSVAYGCIFLHFEAPRNTRWSLQKYTICASDLDIHCYPFIVGQLVRFLDKIALYAESNIEGRKLDVEYENPDVNDFDENDSYESADIPLGHDPCNLSNNIHDMRLKFHEILYLRDQKVRCSKFRVKEKTKMFSNPPANCNFDTDSSVQTSVDRDSLLVNLTLGSIAVHFHDSSSIIGTVVVPLANSLLTISAYNLDLVCSTEGVGLSSSWWSQIITEPLWGPLSSNSSPILNLRLKRRNTGPQYSLLEMSFHIQQVSCMLPPELLTIFIGYFLLPDWSPCSGEQPTDTMNIQDSSTLKYSFEIVDSNIVTPSKSDCSEFLKVNIKQLAVAFSENLDGNSISKNIPSACCVSAGKFSDRNNCLDFSGCDLSLSLLILDRDMVDSLNRCQNLVLVASLSADVWVRIPYDVASSYPVCVMAMINDSVIDIEGM